MEASCEWDVESEAPVVVGGWADVETIIVAWGAQDAWDAGLS
jgi:hypothetical protein